jgi:collagenase-like PrtC family protease
VPKEAKQELKRIYATLNPVKLGREISRLQDQIDALARSKIDAQEEVNLEYIST